MRKFLMALLLGCAANSHAKFWEDPYLAQVADLDLAAVTKLQAAGDMPATVELARRQFAGKNYSEALRLVSIAAARNIPAGVFNLAQIYYYCPASCQDRERAVGYYEQAAGLGHPVAHEVLGDIYQSGQPGTPKDLAKSFRHYLAAAESGLSPAQLNVADMLCRGHGVAKNVAEGRKWVQRMNDEHEVGIEDEDVGCE